MIAVYFFKSNECLPFCLKYDKIVLTRGISMNKILCMFGLMGACLVGNSAFALSAGTVGMNDGVRGAVIQTPTASNVLRGNAGLANAYKTNQRNTYYMVTQPDVDTACRTKIFECLAEFCGDVTIVPGQVSSKCQYATEVDLYNYALLCLQRDNEVLLPQYAVNLKNGMNGINTAARLCPSYIQQEVASYLSMANMADKLSKSQSALCIQRKQELEAAMSCHAVALAYGNETSSKLNSYLTDYCGSGVPGGSAEMVTRFASAGNVGADIWGWAEKIISLDANNKGDDWQLAVDAVLASYTNRMNLACGDNLQINTPARTQSNGTSALQAVANIAVSAAFPSSDQKVENPYANQSIWMDVSSRADIYNASEAQQVINAALGNPSTLQNVYFNSAQIDDMKRAYEYGTKVFILRDSARCYIIPVREMTQQEESLLAQVNANCVYK